MKNIREKNQEAHISQQYAQYQKLYIDFSNQYASSCVIVTPSPPKSIHTVIISNGN